MSGFEALSMVCSIMQVISFTKEVLTLCKDVYDGRPTTDRQMEENMASIGILLNGMRRSGSARYHTKEEEEVYAMAQKCSKAAQEVQKEIQQVAKYYKPGDAIRAIFVGYKSKSHKRKITSLYEIFCQYQKTLETHILVHLCTRDNALELQQCHDFNHLSDTMKQFISQLAAGHTEMAHLITREGIQTRQQIKDTETRLKQSINDTHSAADYEAKKDRLLRSLKYESMNTRRTELKPAHEATYVSIFESLEIDQESDRVSTSRSAKAWKSFVQWLQSDNRVFWIQGKPGAGKSTLLKFLLQHENTQKVVDKWNPNTLIVSHFFWKPGDALQKNFRGLLCSLNYQLLSSKHSAVDYVLSEFLLVKDKDTIGDWEISELESIFHSILIQCKSSVLFLIDGLDEATEIEEILQFLDFLIGLRTIKLCFSSRSEDIFIKRFSKYDGFRLNDLTRDDMLRFALAAIPEPDDRYPSDFLTDLIGLLVDKAEGVYMWLTIALESVKRGIRNNDEHHEIFIRLSKLPSELEKLYSDMWHRLGEDKYMYEKEAARYFDLLILNQSLFDIYSHTYPCIFDFRLSTLQVMLATNKAIIVRILDRSYQLPVLEITTKCVDASKTISIRTAGLLVTKDAEHDFINVYFKGVAIRTGTQPSGLRQHLAKRVDFIHRTLFDFFKESEIGKNILAQSQAHRVDIDLATTILCQLRIIQFHRELAIAHTIAGRIRLGTPLHYFVWLLGHIFTQDTISKSPKGATLLRVFESLFAAGLLPWDMRPEWYPHPCVDVLLINNPAFNEFIQLRVEKRGASHATCILRDLLMTRDSESIGRWHIINNEEYILSLGGDINFDGICLQASPEIVDDFLEPLPYAIGPPEFATYESVLSVVIKRLYNQAFTMKDDEVTTSQEILLQSMRLLIAVLKRAPNLNKHTSFLLGMEYVTDENWQIITELSDLLYTMASIEKKDEKGVMLLNLTPSDGFHAHIIAEVNLKYLIEHFFRIFPINFEDAMPLITHARQLTEMEGSKPYVKARFYVQLSFKTESNPASVTCYRFINQDIDILADSIIMEPTFDGFAWHSLTSQRILDHLDELERVEFSALSVLADEKLGVCRLEDMGIKPPS
ncbi:hypothetical protein V8C40DRAFT_248239 [Trichoderma camerunense]